MESTEWLPSFFLPVFVAQVILFAIIYLIIRATELVRKRASQNEEKEEKSADKGLVSLVLDNHNA